MENAGITHRQVSEELREILPDVRSLLLTLFVANTSNRRADLTALQRARFVIENKMDQVTLERLMKYKQQILKLVDRMKRELYPLMGRSDSVSEGSPPNIPTTVQSCEQPIYQRPPVGDVVGERFPAPRLSPHQSIPNHSVVDNSRITSIANVNQNVVTQEMINNCPEWSLIPAVFDRAPQNIYNVGSQQSLRSDRETAWNNDRESFAASVCSLRSILSDPHILDECWNRWAVNELIGMFRPPIDNNPGWFPVSPAFEAPVYGNVTQGNATQTSNNVESAQSLRSVRETVWNNDTERSTRHGTQTTLDSELENSSRPDEQVHDEGAERPLRSGVESLNNRARHRDAPNTRDNYAPSSRTNEETVQGGTEQSSYRHARISSEQSPRSAQPETERPSRSRAEVTAYDHNRGSSSVAPRRIISLDNHLSRENVNFARRTIENDDGIRSPTPPNRSVIDRTPNENLSPTSVSDLMSNNPVEDAVLNQRPSSSGANHEMEQDRQSSSVDAKRKSGQYQDQYDAVPSTSGVRSGHNSSSFVKLPAPGWQLYRRKSIAVVNHDKTEDDLFDDEEIIPILPPECPHMSTEYSTSDRDTSDLQYIWVLRRKDSFLPSPLIYGMETEKEESSDEEGTERRRRRKRRKLNDEEFLKSHQP